MAVRPLIVWITGRPASGKTTLAYAVIAALEARGQVATLVDSDEVRAAITPHATYSPEERAIVYRSIAYVARRLSEQRIVAIVAATAHDPSLRAAAREVTGGFLLVHARCPLSVCEARDPKGIYARARKTTQGAVPGIHVPWIEPDDADVTVDTDGPIAATAVGEIVERVLPSERDAF
ncbi:MAG: adenylyl-sulfate kinase [Polyangiales bacterium]